MANEADRTKQAIDFIDNCIVGVNCGGVLSTRGLLKEIKGMLTEAEPKALTENDLRKMAEQRVWVQFSDIGMYALVSCLTDEEYQADEEFEQVWLTNSLGGRNSYSDIADKGGVVFDREPKELTLDT